MKIQIFKFNILLQLLVFIQGRKHHLEVKNDLRKYFPITKFGFCEGGSLQVVVDKFKLSHIPENQSKFLGFSFEKIANPYTDQHSKGCELNSLKKNDTLVQQIFFIFDLKQNRVHLECSQSMQNVLIYNYTKQIIFDGPSKEGIRDSSLFLPSDKKSKIQTNGMEEQKKSLVKRSEDNNSFKDHLPMNLDVNSGQRCSQTILTMTRSDEDYLNFTFTVYISKAEEGLYSLSFYNCYNYNPNVQSAVEMILKVEEKNANNYLSAGKIPLPALYFMMSLLFFLSACFWFFLLKKSKEPVFKLHYLMGVLVVIKSLSLLFHGINYHFIQLNGVHMEAWAVMYYIMHLLKGALLFTVLALIGSGWAFIKHVLSSKEKKIFMVVIPLQIIANVATIIIEETEEWNPDRVTWVQLLFLIDFLCCVAILLPVVWSIRHLQEASQTDGKAAINLSKLKLFRHFYIMIVCYIYFTRIIVYLLQITVTFQYEWLDDMFREMATYVFFVMTGYKFRPATNNPYFAVQSDDEEMEEVLTSTSLTENLIRVNSKRNDNKRSVTEVYDEDEEVNLLQHEEIKENSHIFD
ncbi:UNVERIFIED_CONTAM: hypothetical protein RMT77_002372 [Armadillidium vulgare]